MYYSSIIKLAFFHHSEPVCLKERATFLAVTMGSHCAIFNCSGDQIEAYRNMIAAVFWSIWVSRSALWSAFSTVALYAQLFGKIKHSHFVQNTKASRRDRQGCCLLYVCRKAAYASGAQVYERTAPPGAWPSRSWGACISGQSLLSFSQ